MITREDLERTERFSRRTWGGKRKGDYLIGLIKNISLVETRFSEQGRLKMALTVQAKEGQQDGIPEDSGIIEIWCPSAVEAYVRSHRLVVGDIIGLFYDGDDPTSRKKFFRIKHQATKLSEQRTGQYAEKRRDAARAVGSGSLLGSEQNRPKNDVEDDDLDLWPED